MRGQELNQFAVTEDSVGDVAAVEVRIEQQSGQSLQHLGSELVVEIVAV